MISNDDSERELGTAVEENLFALFRTMARAAGGDLLETDTVSCHSASRFNPMFNGAWRTRLTTADEIDTVVDDTKMWFAARQVPFFFWWIGPHTTPENLPSALVQRGFIQDLADAPGMAAAIDRLRADIQSPRDFQVTRAANAIELGHWRDVFATVYGVPFSAAQAWIEPLLEGTDGQAPWSLYLGYWQQKPVAISMLFTGAGVAGIHCVGVVEDLRGAGAGASMTMIPLLHARAIGYDMAVLYSTRAGYPLYRRLGFNDVSCRIARYLWPGD